MGLIASDMAEYRTGIRRSHLHHSVRICMQKQLLLPGWPNHDAGNDAVIGQFDQMQDTSKISIQCGWTIRPTGLLNREQIHMFITLGRVELIHRILLDEGQAKCLQDFVGKHLYRDQQSTSRRFCARFGKDPNAKTDFLCPGSSDRAEVNH